MKLHFDSNHEYWKEAVRAVTDIFEGQPLSGGNFEFSLTATGDPEFKKLGENVSVEWMRK